MRRKLIVIVLAVIAFGFGSAVRSNAGTEVVEPYRAPAPSYNYAPPPPPPPRPIYFAPPVVGFVVGPRYGYYGRGYVYYGAHRFYGRHAYWRQHRHWH
ncbi:MAG: hypothetical protein DMF24_05235 [Verrucomicrobia bacterium]|nr:MAG: hypothetical protein DMF24_05235 [Verrucomicrobiota bacterium]